MRTILTLFVLTVFVNASGQDKSIIKGDTLYYAGAKFFKGQVITLAYGSAADRKFAFVGIAGALMGGDQGGAPASFGKMEAQITKFQKGSSIKTKNFIRAKMIGVSATVLIDVEGAIDNGELAKLNQ